MGRQWKRFAALGAVLVLGLSLASGHAAEPQGLATERVKRGSGIEIAPDERLWWGNLVVHARGSATATLTGVRLLGADSGLRLRRAFAADGRRPQPRVLVFGDRRFRRQSDAAAWRRSLHPLRGYRVKPVTGPWQPGNENYLTRDGRFRDTEIVLEFRPVGRGSFQITGGVRLLYRVGGRRRQIDLPNQLSVCAPRPCEYEPPSWW